MEKPKFNENDKIDNTFTYDGDHYIVQNGYVFKMLEDEGYQYTDEITPEELELYGNPLIEKPTIVELKILNIKELSDGTALIKGKDGDGLELVFKDEKYSKSKEKYEIGRISQVYLFADILTCELPDDYAKGICLKGEDAIKWYKWTGQEELIGLIDNTWTNLYSAAVYSETENFNETGIYTFHSIVVEPGFVSFDENQVYDEDGELICDVFKLVLPNQFNKRNPIFVLAQIMTGKFPPRIFKNLPEDEETDFTESGWALKGTVRFTAYTGEEWWAEQFEDEEIISLYGEKPCISYIERFSIDDDDECNDNGFADNEEI